jgi:hypothetical protein
MLVVVGMVVILIQAVVLVPLWGTAVRGGFACLRLGVVFESAGRTQDLPSGLAAASQINSQTGLQIADMGYKLTLLGIYGRRGT